MRDGHPVTSTDSPATPTVEPPPSAPPRPQRLAGVALMALAGLHVLATLAGAGDAVLAILRDGLFNAVGTDFYRAAVFWSLQFGALLFLIGWLLHRNGSRRPLFARSVGAFMLIAFTLGAIIVPVGGFWLGIPIALVVISGGQ